MKRIGLVVAWVVCCGCRCAFADCFETAASYQGVSAPVLRAIAWIESRGNPAAEHRNANGSVDIGELQINSVHLRELAAYGIGERALRDECVNIYVAAWRLKKQMIKYGNTWEAIGAYHSETPQLRDAYARLIRVALAQWGLFAAALKPSALRAAAYRAVLSPGLQAKLENR